MDWGQLWLDLLQWEMDFRMRALNALISFLASLVELAASILPTWQPLDVGTLSDTYNVIGSLNWLFPVSYAVTVLNAFVLSTVAYFTIGIITRWAKVTN